MHAIRILRSRGVGDAQLQLVYRAVVFAKLTYASSSWWGFTTASDRQRLEGFLRRGCRQNLYSTDKPSITQIVEEADENLSIASDITHLILSTSFYLDELNRVPVDSSTDQFGDKTIRRQGRTIRWTIGMIRQHDRTIRWQFYQFGDRWQRRNRVEDPQNTWGHPARRTNQYIKKPNRILFS